MQGDFFVMLTMQNGGYTPLVDKMGELAKYETEDEADTGAKSTVLGSEFGFEVFERGMGC